ncbi:lipid asymmetry maintenance protein MlaB [Streptosporangium sp. NPDC002721]|uniref:STAS domain-containing protein n=1 Tax=Streptosporangium sp. NPDC002721 TaxID=3366188 RepID=UPI0036CADE2C
MAVVQHRPVPVDSRARRHRLPNLSAVGPRRTLDGETMTVQEQGTSGEWVDAVLYLDRTLRITYSPAPPGGAVRLIGELDATNTREAAQTLAQVQSGEDILVIDVGQVEFVDLAGLRMLTGLCRDGVARLVNVPTGMRRLLGLLERADVLDQCA